MSSVFFRRFEYDDRTKLTDSAYGEIKAAIIDLRLQPGDMLRESTIAQQLGTSKTPVREALLRLAQDGLVQLVPYKGAMVTGYSVNDVREIFELREILEAECARRVARDQDEHLITSLRTNVEAARLAAAEERMSEVIRLFDEFDAMLFSKLDNERLRQLVQNLQLHMKRIGKLTTEIPGRVDTSVRQHGDIVVALEAADVEAAQHAIRTHISSVLADELEHMEHHPDGEEPAGVPRGSANPRG